MHKVGTGFALGYGKTFYKGDMVRINQSDFITFITVVSRYEKDKTRMERNTAGA